MFWNRKKRSTIHVEFVDAETGAVFERLYSLVATCEANGVNPVDYLADVLLRVQTHPVSRIDQLLPHNWTLLNPERSG